MRVTDRQTDRQTDGETDGETDRITTPKTALAYARAVKTKADLALYPRNNIHYTTVVVVRSCPTVTTPFGVVTNYVVGSRRRIPVVDDYVIGAEYEGQLTVIHANKAFTDIRLRPGIATPLATHRHTVHHYTQTWHQSHIIRKTGST